MSTTINLSQLPAPNVVEIISFEVIFAEMLADLQARDPQFTALVQSDPAYKILEVAAYREVLIRQRVNDGARAVMLAYATGADLEALAALFNLARQANETDDALRNRILLAPEGYTTAGSTGAYEFHTFSADARVKDVDITSPLPADGTVNVTVLSTETDGTASQDLLNVVDAALSPDDIRPLNDNPVISSASIIAYVIDATLTFYSGPDPNTVRQAAEDAVTEFVDDHHRLGHDITLSGLYAALHQPGVQNVTLISPTADIVVAAQEAAYPTSTTITAGGTDE